MRPKPDIHGNYLIFGVLVMERGFHRTFAQHAYYLVCAMLYTSLSPSLSLSISLSVDVWTLAYTPDGRHLATGSHGGKINLFNTDTGTRTSTFDTRGKFTLSVACVSTCTH